MSSLCPLISDEVASAPTITSRPNAAILSANIKKLGRKQIRMINTIRAGIRFSSLGFVLTLFVAIILSASTPPVRCQQDFEDLKQNNNRQPSSQVQQQQFLGAPQQLPQASFQPSRQSQAQFIGGESIAPPQQYQAPPSSRQSSLAFQRPVLSTRFSPQSSLSQQPSAQASTISGLAVASQQQQQQQSAASTVSNGNIEQFMRSPLARTAKLETSNPNIESRQDNAQAISQPAQASVTTTPVESVAEPSEATPRTLPADEGEKVTTQPGHETVYSDQRFANLFARRGQNNKKAKFVPTEQVKAKPTLPSFIKSPPDPKQFTSAPDGPDRSLSQASTNLVSARLQQQQQQSNQNRPATTQKKASAALNSNPVSNNKRANSQKQVQPVGPTAKATTNSSKLAGNQTAGSAAAIKPTLTSNNPFSKSPGNSNDPANVIAAARRRLLANNALQQKQASN